MTQIWVGIDAGQDSHHAAAVDAEGRLLWSMRVLNDQQQIQQLIERIDPHVQVMYAVDLIGCETSLLRGMLATTGHQLVYVPGRTVNRMASAFAGEAKTDARDALVIANTARLRRDLTPVKPSRELIAELSLLVSHRADLIEDWTRTVNRLHRLMLGICPALERALNYTTQGALTLIAKYQTPQQLRDAGRDALIAYLRQHHVQHVLRLVDTALAAAEQQTIVLPGQDTAARLASQVAQGLLELRHRITAIDKTIAARFDDHPQAAIIRSMPGIGPLIAAEFVVAVGDLSTFRSPDHLAAYAGLAPVPRDSGKRTGNMRRPQRYNRRLRHVFYMAAMTTLRADGPNRDYYQRKRAEGRKHQQALIALARRRIKVLWALLRDNRTFQPTAPVPQPA